MKTGITLKNILIEQAFGMLDLVETPKILEIMFKMTYIEKLEITHINMMKILITDGIGMLGLGQVIHYGKN